jgi:hypothetical protein
MSMLSHLRRVPIVVWLLLLTALPHLAYVLMHWYHFPMHNGKFIAPTDPDSWLRLTLVREWLISGDWYDHMVTHSNAPWGGISSPWTRPLDMVIAGLVQLQPESVELNLRLLRASLLLPWIWMTLLVVGVYRILHLRATPPSTYLMASFLIACTPTLWNYFALGNADHHAPLAVLFIWALGGILRPAPTRHALILTGLLLALQLWISVEALILIAAIYGWYGLQWLRGNREAARPLATLASSVAVGTTIAFLLERPPSAWLSPLYDTISIVHAAALLLAALVAWGLHATWRPRLRQRLAQAAGYSIAALAVLYACYPNFFGGPMVGVDPYIFSHFLPNISEAQPFYHMPLNNLAATIILPLAAIILCLAPWLRPERAFYDREHASILLFFTVVTLILYYTQQRWSYYALPVAIVVLAPILGALFTPEHPSIRGRWPASFLLTLTAKQQAMWRLPVLIALAGVPIFILLSHAVPAFTSAAADSIRNHQSTAEKAALLKQRTTCYTTARQLLAQGVFATIDGKQSASIFAPTDLGAEIMFWTYHRIVASNYHREGAGIRYLWEAVDIKEEAALRSYLAIRDIDAVLLCPAVETVEGSVLHAIAAGKRPPAWLRAIPLQAPADSSAEAMPRLFTIRR